MALYYSSQDCQSCWVVEEDILQLLLEVSALDRMADMREVVAAEPLAATEVVSHQDVGLLWVQGQIGMAGRW